MGVLLIFVAAFASFALTGAVRRYALRANLVDLPNERSSHDVPTARGGGVGIVVVFCATTMGMALVTETPAWALVGVLVGGVVVSSIGYWDDHHHVPAQWRLLAHMLAAVAAVVALGGLPPLSFGPWIVDFGVAGYALAVLLIVWSVNLYNFMDGIDGLAGIELVTVASGATLLLATHELWMHATWLMVFAACGVGFLIWNWPPAKVFMGDVGSGFVGFVFGAFLVWTGGHDGIGVWAWIILLGSFLVDATWTLLRRLASGERLAEAHRTHAYQYAARSLGGHGPVTLAVALLNLVWLLPLAALASWRPEWGFALLLLAWSPLAYLCWRYNAGVPEAKQPKEPG